MQVDGCNFFEWIDPEMCIRAKMLINELNRERKQLWSENRRVMNQSMHLIEIEKFKYALSRMTTEKEKIENEAKEMEEKKNLYKLEYFISWVFVAILVVVTMKM